MVLPVRKGVKSVRQNMEEMQRKMAEAMFTAFEKYKTELDQINGVTKTTNNESGNSASTEVVDLKDKVVFRVQIETSEKKIASTSPKFKGLKVFEYMQDNLYKYTVGEFVHDFVQNPPYLSGLGRMGFPKNQVNQKYPEQILAYTFHGQGHQFSTKPSLHFF